MRGVSWAEREALSARVNRVREVSLFMGTGEWRMENEERRMKKEE
jgi:hypothetical protein